MHKVVWVENQLEKVQIDLLKVGNAAQTAKEVHVKAEVCKSKINSKLKATLAILEETTLRVAVLESGKMKLRQ